MTVAVELYQADHQAATLTVSRRVDPVADRDALSTALLAAASQLLAELSDAPTAPRLPGPPRVGDSSTDTTATAGTHAHRATE